MRPLSEETRRAGGRGLAALFGHGPSPERPLADQSVFQHLVGAGRTRIPFAVARAGAVSASPPPHPGALARGWRRPRAPRRPPAAPARAGRRRSHERPGCRLRNGEAGIGGGGGRAGRLRGASSSPRCGPGLGAGGGVSTPTDASRDGTRLARGAGWPPPKRTATRLPTTRGWSRR